MTQKVEIATGGDPAGALLEAIAAERPTDGGVYRLSVAHDDECPCVTQGEPMHACSCEIVVLKRERIR